MERLKKPMDEIIEVQKEAIELEELNAAISGKPKTDLLARLYRVQAHMYFQIDNTEESIRMAEQSISIYEVLGNQQEVMLLKSFCERLGKSPLA